MYIIIMNHVSIDFVYTVFLLMYPRFFKIEFELKIMIFLQREWHKRFGNASMAIYNVISSENVQRFLSKKNLFNTRRYKQL